jgi:hypothetical protein
MRIYRIPNTDDLYHQVNAEVLPLNMTLLIPYTSQIVKKSFQ